MRCGNRTPPPFSGESGGDFSERRRRLSGCAFFGGRTAGRLLRGGKSPPQRKALQGVKKARRRKQSTLWNADQNIVFTIIVKESTEGSPLFCFRGKLRQKFPGGATDFSPAGGKPQSRRLGGGACGVRKSSRRGCVGQARRREKHRKGLKKPGGESGVCFGTPLKKM